MQISAVIITFNEERNIGRCLDSLAQVADEIIVLDSFSTDRTLDIVKEKGATLHQREWAGYTNAKNYANSLTKHDVILSIDADEALDETLKTAIQELKSKPLEKAYSVNRLTNYCGKWIRHSGWYPDVKTRLFSKSKVSWEGEFVHEELEFNDQVEIELLPGHLEHYSYYSFQDHRQRADKYSELTAKKHVANGKKASLLKPYVSAIARFITMFFIKKGFLDGRIGYKIALISAQSNIYKYKEVRRLTREKR